MMKDPVEESGGKDRITHHFSPFCNSLVGSEDDRGVFIGIADEGKEPVGLVTGYWGVPDFIDDDHLSFFHIA